MTLNQLNRTTTVRFGGIGTGISEPSKRVPIFDVSFDVTYVTS
jgi:hypothetical protein